MSKLSELEHRLRSEPENLGLRVTVAAELRTAGRDQDAVELYRSVAIAYRDQGRVQQALAVCRSILELAPRDAPCRALVDALRGRPQALDETPLPRALPHHIADPTTGSVPRMIEDELIDPAEPEDLPVVEGADTRPGADAPRRPTVTGLASAARRITASLAGERDEMRRGVADGPVTRRHARVELDDDDDDALLTPPMIGRDDEQTSPRDLFAQRDGRSAPAGPSGGRFFAPLPAAQRAPILARFLPRTVAAGTTIIRQGELAHPLVVVARGRLDVRADRGDGEVVQIASLGVGEFIGEAALLARAPAAATIIASTNAELLLLAPRDFYEIAAAFPALWAELKDVAERRTREHDRRVRRS